jgi:DNA-directed RNA polymerase subunit RPC12/RpoP
MKSIQHYPALFVFLAAVACATALFAFFFRLWWPFSLLLYLAILGASLTILVRSHSRDTNYSCRACDTRFEISPWQDFISPHTLTQKYLKCPHCGARSWATIHEKLREHPPLQQGTPVP